VGSNCVGGRSDVMTWTKMSDTYYQSMYYDVFFEYGVWKGAFYLYRPFSQDFATPESAMRFCERWSRDPFPEMS
jgi:hypothetical protein